MEENVTAAVRNFFLAMYRTQNVSHSMDIASCYIDNSRELDEFEKRLTQIKNRTRITPALFILVSDDPIEWKEVKDEELLQACGL